MLGKQWLNRYASTNLRGTTIERSQNRQRKLDGIVVWYFDYVMESLPLMLQVALLLLGCALTRYLWEVNITVASVVLGITSSTLIFYAFIVAAGAAYESCPYQTPGSHALRYLRPKAQRMLYSVIPFLAATGAMAATAIASVFRYAVMESVVVGLIGGSMEVDRWCSASDVVLLLVFMVLGLPVALVVDAFRLGGAVIRVLAAVLIRAYQLCFLMAKLLVSLAHRVHNWLESTSSTPEQGLDQQITALDLQCISWMLQVSLDKAVHLSTLKHLATITTLVDFDPTLVIDCFNIFIGCIHISGSKVVITQGLEQLATVSVMCLLNTFQYLSIVDPTLGILEDVCKRYNGVLPFNPDFSGLPFYCTMVKIHTLVNRGWWHRHIWWDNYKPSTQKHILVAQDMVKGAQAGYQESQCRKVPRWILRFALHSLFPDPPPPTSVVVNCLLIIAIDLGCDGSNTGISSLTSDERCVCV